MVIGESEVIINGPLHLMEDGSIISFALAQPAFIDGVEYKRGDILYFSHDNNSGKPGIVRIVTEDDVKIGKEIVSNFNNDLTIN